MVVLAAHSCSGAKVYKGLFPSKPRHLTIGRRRVNMPIKPYVPDLEAWRHHFKNQEYGKKYHVVKPVKKVSKEEEKEVKVAFVAPTEQTVKRAKALTKKRKIEF